MAGLSLTQIINRLNEEFTGDTRKLVFWYDDNGEFVEDMQRENCDSMIIYGNYHSNLCRILSMCKSTSMTSSLHCAFFPLGRERCGRSGCCLKRDN